MCMVFAFGCSQQQSADAALALRERMLSAEGCSFRAEITADYVDRVYTFLMDCEFDNVGNMSFSVTEPETISGITGNVAAEGGTLTFDDQILAFELLADDQLTPVCAPWIFLNAMRSGYIHNVSQRDTGMEICVDDSYDDNALQVNIQLNAESLPEQVEIFWMNRRILSIHISNFRIL